MPVATIMEIMESCPLGLRLRIRGERGELLVDLTDDCQIMHTGRSMKPDQLRCGMSVRIASTQTRVLSSLEVVDPTA